MFRIFSARVITEYSQRTKSQKRQWKKTIGKENRKNNKQTKKRERKRNIEFVAWLPSFA